jgi:vacuolar protein sorting-associated protein 33A
LDAEQGLFGCLDQALEYIEESIARAAPIVTVLRLLTLQCLTNNGLKPKTFDFFRREILQTYGNEYLFTLLNMERLGLIFRQDNHFNYPTLCKSLKLLDKECNIREPTDFNYVYSGYAPLSVRLIQHAAKPNGWRAIDESMRSLQAFGPTFEFQQDIPAGVRQCKLFGFCEFGGDLLICVFFCVVAVDSATASRSKVTLVYFIGGVTYAEISALR